MNNTAPLYPARVGDTIEVNGWEPVAIMEFDEMPADTIISDTLKTKQIWSRDEFTNGEEQYYVDYHEHGIDPFVFEPGVGMHIEAQPTKAQDTMRFLGQAYTSGLLSSHKTPLVIETGRISIRAKLPAGLGLWPAFWLYPEFDEWPEGIDVLPEIDIMESIGDSALRYYTNIHSRHFIEGSDQLASSERIIDVASDLTLGFHTYGVELGAKEIRLFLDDQVVRVSARPADLQGPLHFMLNLAVGGDWPGSPPDTTPFPARFTISDLVIERFVGERSVNGDLIDKLEEMRRDIHQCIDARFDKRLRELS